MIQSLKPYEHSDQIPHGTLQTFEMEMTPYPDRRTRTIRVWLPEEYDGVKRFPVIYLHDGQSVFRGLDDRAKWDIDRILTDLAPEGISAIVVAVDTAPTRGSELTPPYPMVMKAREVGGVPVPVIREESTHELYAEFLIRYLKPEIDATFRTLPDALHTCIGGGSAGGNASYSLFLHHPDVFGKAMVFSPGFPLFPLEVLLDELEHYDFSRLTGHRICFYNGDQGIDVTSTFAVMEVYRKLRAMGMDATQNMALIDTRQTHYESGWSIYLPEMLRFLFLENNLAVYPPEQSAT